MLGAARSSSTRTPTRTSRSRSAVGARRTRSSRRSPVLTYGSGWRTDMLENLGRKFARFTTNQVVRRPGLWPLFRRLTRSQFNRIAPRWDEMRSPEAFAPLEAALDALAMSPGRVLDLGTGTGRAAFLLARRYPEAQVVGVDLAEDMIVEARRLTPP